MTVTSTYRLGHDAGIPHDFGSGTSDIGLENVDCWGAANDLSECDNGDFILTGDTNHNDDVGVKCFNGKQFFLSSNF